MQAGLILPAAGLERAPRPLAPAFRCRLIFLAALREDKWERRVRRPTLRVPRRVLFEVGGLGSSFSLAPCAPGLFGACAAPAVLFLGRLLDSGRTPLWAEWQDILFNPKQLSFCSLLSRTSPLRCWDLCARHFAEQLQTGLGGIFPFSVSEWFLYLPTLPKPSSGLQGPGWAGGAHSPGRKLLFFFLG